MVRRLWKGLFWIHENIAHQSELYQNQTKNIENIGIGPMKFVLDYFGHSSMSLDARAENLPI